MHVCTEPSVICLSLMAFSLIYFEPYFFVCQQLNCRIFHEIRSGSSLPSICLGKREFVKSVSITVVLYFKGVNKRVLVLSIFLVEFN